MTTFEISECNFRGPTNFLCNTTVLVWKLYRPLWLTTCLCILWYHMYFYTPSFSQGFGFLLSGPVSQSALFWLYWRLKSIEWSISSIVNSKGGDAPLCICSAFVIPWKIMILQLNSNLALNLWNSLYNKWYTLISIFISY